MYFGIKVGFWGKKYVIERKSTWWRHLLAEFSTITACRILDPKL